MLWLLLLLPGFSEVMPDPPGADNNLEFVEVAWNESIENVTFVLGDSSSNDTAELVTTIGNGSLNYLLFVEEGYNYSQINHSGWNHSCAIYSVGTTIGNNLGNENDSLQLFWNDTNLSTNYTVTGCAAGEGCSLSYEQSHNLANDSSHDWPNGSANGSWVPTPPSPCTANIHADETPVNESCTFNVTIETESVYSVGDTIEYKPVLTPKPQEFTIAYWWEDLYGEVVKDVQETTNTNTKRYTPKQPANERDWVLLAKMVVDACNESVAVEQLVAMKGLAIPVKECPAPTQCSSTGSVVVSTPSSEQPVLAAVLPEAVVIGEPLRITATLYNEQFREERFNVSAYVYKGSKNYTSREPVQVVVASFSDDGVSFELLPELEPGEYSVKVKAEKEGRVTPYEERRTVVFTAPPTPIMQEPLREREENDTANVTDEVLAPLPPITGRVTETQKSSRLWVSVSLAAGLLLLAHLSRRRSDVGDSETQ